MSNAGSDFGNSLKGAVKGIHGIGETIRGTVNQGVDSAFNEKGGEAKNRAIAENGVREMQDGKTGATTGQDMGSADVGPTTQSDHPGRMAGAHSGAVGNMQSNPVSTSNMASEPTTRTERY